MDTFILLAATYESTDAAIADYDAVHTVYKETDLLDTYDAAVISKSDGGKVKIVKKHEQPTRQGSWGGLGIGLVGGALVALFPAVGIGAGLLVGGGGGAALGALAGHVAAGLSRSDLKELGELLDAGDSGLLVVAATDLESRVEKAIERADKLTKKQLEADVDQVSKEIDAASA
ncbi:DUF1269 domain-containing protein [Aldersonia sp. NBC_00410]|uniref:DUF1269 domain-containing protein n=1 Tax=Aldersonia sp. NBC_00410 TaxID=2975954 RepID=UPI00224D790A|nr:DUF1269 domain-containing protein [Aldersonia sp. NBC_00410]MCX5044751.1 DUF1269 domain-containing protein [Aldersonia sp. NBC_00410]